MKRIIFHWTAGTHKVSSLDRQHYHRIFAGNGTMVLGQKTIEANRSTKDGDYAAHTLGCNTDSIGLAVACMHNAKSGAHGKYPMTEAQFEAMIREAARLCVHYGIEVSPRTTLWHAEVEPNLGIKQRGKWDATEISFRPELKGYKSCGSYLRSQLAFEVERLKQRSAAPMALMATTSTETTMNPLAILDGYKTYIIGILGLAIGLAELLGIDVIAGVDQSTAWTTIQVALTGMFLKRGQTTAVEAIKK